jgi:tetratricopeptide (TPR) repeat protein
MTKYIRFHYIAIFVLSLLSVALYLNSLNNSFHFDDQPNILDNPYIRNLKDVSLFWKGIGSYVGIPRALTMLSFAINYHFHRFNVWGYHLVNLTLHVLCGILAFLVARALFSLEFEGEPHPDKLRINLLSFLSALIFVSHPVQVNTVTYIVQRNEELATFFYLLSLFLFISGSFKRGWKKLLLFLGSGGSFLCSIFSKETGFTVPLTIIFFDFIFVCKGKKDRLKRLKIYLPLSLILAIYMLFFLRGGVLHLLVEKSKGEIITPWRYLLTQANVVIQYFKLLFLPLPHWLNVDHDFPLFRSLFEYPTFLSVSILLLLIALAAYLLNKKRLISFCIFFFFIVLAPSSSIIPLWDFMVEYRLYLPLLSYALILSIGFGYLYQFLTCHCSKKMAFGIVSGVSVLLISFYSALAIERNHIFKDDLTLWSDAAKKSPYKMRVHHNLGRAYFEKGRIDKAIQEGEIALRLSAHLDRKENVKFVLNLIGGAYFLKGETEAALRMFQRAIEIDPNFATSYYNLSCVLATKKEKEKALEYLKKAISLDPKYKEKARADGDFRPLKGEEEFEELLR